MLTRLFCEIDDFCQGFLPHWKASVLEPPTTRPKRNRPCGLSLSEVMTIWVHYHQSGYHTFKWYYLKHVQVYLKSAFPQLPSYQRFIERVPDVLVPLTRFMELPSLTPPPYASVTIFGFPVIRPLPIPQDEGSHPPAGSMASSCISW